MLITLRFLFFGKRYNIFKNLQTPEIQKLSDLEIIGVVGGGTLLADKVKSLETHLVNLEAQLENWSLD